MGIRALILCMAWLFFTTTASARITTDLDEISRKEIAERIAPVGKACETDQECAKNAGVIASSSSSGPRSGEQVFNQFCTACHTPGLLNAPKINDKATWSARMDELGGFDKLLSNAINGIGSMPAKGTCMNCSDDEISSAIEYMSGLKP
ncbi:c-type cytochrome [Endozoicomonas sp. Mp262]|uniref:c-type cytochrome n=1 Tax=Endozoicomonas sp. Mp262 TaxID=2919499 RepID=UPI0021D8D50A